MSLSAARASNVRDRTSLYQEITDRIIAELEAGRVPLREDNRAIIRAASAASKAADYLLAFGVEDPAPAAAAELAVAA